MDNGGYRPYSYLIGWSKQDLWYYGVEFSNKGKIANPQNLWTVYFTSSKYVQESRSLYAKTSGEKISRSQKERYRSGVKPWNYGLKGGAR